MAPIIRVQRDKALKAEPNIMLTVDTPDATQIIWLSNSDAILLAAGVNAVLAGHNGPFQLKVEAHQ